MSKRMTKGELQESLGAFNPVGHAVLAFANDAVAADARKALEGDGFDEPDPDDDPPGGDEDADDSDDEPRHPEAVAAAPRNEPDGPEPTRSRPQSDL